MMIPLRVLRAVVEPVRVSYPVPFTPHNLTPHSPSPPQAHRRLYRDYLELQASPLPGINASPPDADNPWVWHASIRCEDRSSLRGNVQHASLTFPETYPDDPPTVRLLTTLHGHGNVFGDYLCMDMLRRQPGLYVGWSSAYSVSSVLLQARTGDALVSSLVSASSRSS